MRTAGCHRNAFAEPTTTPLVSAMIESRLDLEINNSWDFYQCRYP